MTPLWQPTDDQIDTSQMADFARFVSGERSLQNLPSYQSLYDWSIDDPAAFWSSVWDYSGVIGERGSDRVVTNGEQMPGASWFPDAKLNFAENLLRRRDDGIALVGLLENGERNMLSYAQLHFEVAALAAALRSFDVRPGDRVGGFLPNIPETIVAMLATTAIGAVWTSCSPDFGFQGVMDRFGQAKPKVLFAADSYLYNGRYHDCREKVAKLALAVDGLEQVVMIESPPEQRSSIAIRNEHSYTQLLDRHNDQQAMAFECFDFDHPLYIMYSSGTTGVPKCIVHGAGGTLIQHLKEHRLHCDLREDDVFFYFTTCGWMMWNWLVSGLASGATLVLYDGSPFADNGRVLLDAIERERISVFGTSAKYLSALEKSGLVPSDTHDLSSLRAVLSTGSPLSHESFDYVYRAFKQDLLLASIAGGTDIISCFVGGSPTLPVYPGQIQCRGLGMAVEFWDDAGEPLGVGEKGELVCVKPFPSMPIGFWNDEGGASYHRAYFDRFDNVWCHGDYGELTAEGGVIIHGRSDAVLNPGGVRIGTAEIYRQVEKLEEVSESLVIGQDWQGDVRVVLFVVLKETLMLDESMKDAIRQTIRSNTTPRHVPARIIQVPEIPRTLSGKIVELAVRNVVHGRAVINQDALANPEALAHFKDLAELRE